MSIVRFVVVLLFVVALPLAGQSTGVRVSQLAIFDQQDAVLETGDGRAIYVSEDGLVEFEGFSFQLFPDGPEINERLRELGFDPDERWFYLGWYEYLVYGDFLGLEILAHSFDGTQPTYFLLANYVNGEIILHEPGLARFAAYDGIIVVIQKFDLRGLSRLRGFDTGTSRVMWDHTWEPPEDAERPSGYMIGQTDIDEDGIRVTLRNGTRSFFDWTSGKVSCP